MDGRLPMQWSQMPSRAVEYLKLCDWLIEALMRLSLIAEISHANPHGVRSAAGLQALREEEMVVPNSYRVFLQTPDAQLSEHKLALAAELYTEARYIAVLGDRRAAQVIGGWMLPALSRVRVEDNGLPADSRSALLAMAGDLWEGGYFNPMRQEEAERFNAFVQGGGLDFSGAFPGNELNEEIVQRHLSVIRDGRAQIVPTPYGEFVTDERANALCRPFQDHDAMIKALAASQDKPEYASWDKAAQRALDTLILNHVQARMTLMMTGRAPGATPPSPPSGAGAPSPRREATRRGQAGGEPSAERAGAQ